MGDDADDGGFAGLPRRLQARIDGAFDEAVRNSGPSVERARKRRKVESSSTAAAGGFMADEGGFMEDDGPAGATGDEEKATDIGLSLIPGALQLVGIHADEDVLSVFRNAGSGWGSEGAGEERSVSREDWRAVCGALLEGEEEEAGEEGEAGEAGTESESGTGWDSDRHGTQKAVQKKEEECRRAFALFFPSVAEGELGQQRLGITEIAAAAKLLKEKLSEDEMVEMVEAYASGTELSLCLDDFERMMTAANLF